MADDPEWRSVEEREFNPWALAGMVVATLVAMASLFVVPLLQGSVLSLPVAFVLLCVIEGGAALVVIACLSRLHTDREYDDDD